LSAEKANAKGMAVTKLPSRLKRRLLTGLVPSLLAAGIVIHLVDWESVFAALINAKPMYLIAGFLFFNVGVVLRAWRWSILLRPVVPEATTRSCYGFFVVGYMVNMLLPFRAGDVARAALVKRWKNVSGLSVLATIAVEKTLDLFIAFMMTVYLLLQPELPFNDAISSILVVGGALLIMLLIWGMSRSTFVRSRILRGFRSFPVFGEKLEVVLRKLIVAMEAVTSLSDVAKVIGASVLVWVPGYFVVASFLYASGLELPASAPIAVIVVSVFGLAIPTAPGNIGVAHLLYVGAVVLYGEGVSEATAFAVIMHGVPHFWIIVLGVGLAWRLGLGYSLLTGAGELEKNSESIGQQTDQSTNTASGQ
jgi:glycosyltransferase 2 family protein